MSTTTHLPIVLAMTGASGAPFAVRLLQQLTLADRKVHLLVSPSGAAVLAQELNLELGANRSNVTPLLSYHWRSPENLPPQASVWHPLSTSELARCAANIELHDYRNFMTPVASGSHLTEAMIVCPCSGATLSGIVHAAGNNLIQRAADVHLKEHRKLILVPRETPMSPFQLENLHRAAQAGAIVLPAMPGWYHGVYSPVDLIDFIVARILDHLRIDHQLMKRWAAEPIDCNPQHASSGDE